jgi:hypothetical protein
MSGRTFEKFELIKRVLAHGRFVLHGSNVDDLRWIEPRPATGYGQGYRPSGVYATEDVACAIFYAVVDRTKVRWFAASRGVYCLDPVEGALAPWVPGAVYVLDRGDFDVVDGNLVSTAAVKAVGKVAVTVEDFPLLAQVRHQTRAAWLAERGAG